MEPKVVIREATEEDSSKVWDRMLEPMFRTGETFCVPMDVSKEQALASWSGDGRRVFVAGFAAPDGGFTEEAMAEGMDHPVGTFFFGPARQGNGAHNATCGFVTAPNLRRKGIGRAMLAHIFELALFENYRTILLDFVVSTNTTALSLLLEAGFEQIGVLQGAFEHPRMGYVDAVILSKQLDEPDLAERLRAMRTGSAVNAELLGAPSPGQVNDDDDEIVPVPQVDNMPTVETPASTGPSCHGKAPPPPEGTRTPLLDDDGFDQNDPLHFIHSFAYKVDQYLSPRPEGATKTLHNNGTTGDLGPDRENSDSAAKAEGTKPNPFAPPVAKPSAAPPSARGTPSPTGRKKGVKTPRS
jgi:GNAT superfamily N-acetyltransferase